MRYLFLTVFLFTTAIYGAKVNVVGSKFVKTEYGSEAHIITDKVISPSDVYLNSYNNLLIISLKNGTLLGRSKGHIVKDPRVLKTWIAQANPNRVDFRVRFKSVKYLIPAFNEIKFDGKIIIVKLFKSKEAMNIFYKKEKLLTEKKVEKKGKTDNVSIVKPKDVEVDDKKSEKKGDLLADKKEDSGLSSKLAKKDGSIPDTVLWFFGVLAVFAGFVYYKKYKGDGSVLQPNSGIKILSNKTIGNKKNLLMVEVNGDHLLIGSSENGIQVLSKFETDDLNNIEEKIEKNSGRFESDLDNEIDSLERTFFEHTSGKKFSKGYSQYRETQKGEPEVVSHIGGGGRKLKNIKKL